MTTQYNRPNNTTTDVQYDPSDIFTPDTIDSVRAIVDWYIRNYWKKAHDGGLFPWLSSRDQLGEMAVSIESVLNGGDQGLFKVLIVLSMFQRLRDTFVTRILRSFSEEAAAELTNPGFLLDLAKSSGCPHSATQESLRNVCDLMKDGATRLGACSTNPNCPCYLKRHTVLLRRYGHFGKVPTSAALALSEDWGGSLTALKARVFQGHEDPLARAKVLEREICRVWRIDKKVACMFLSAVSAPDLGLETPPWQVGIDWTWFLPIDVNIDRFLHNVGWSGPWTYEARRKAIHSLSEKVRLGLIKSGLKDYNPRLVLQAINRFMSKSNRREAPSDCSLL